MRRKVLTRAHLSFSFVVCIFLNGCNTGEQIAPVRGRVTYNGKAVAAGSKITYYPEHGRPSAAAINDDGTYVLTYLTPGDGALIGEHKVAIQSTKVGPASMTELPKSVEEEIAMAKKAYPRGRFQVAGKLDWLVPEKYSRRETTPLTATVEKGQNEINFDIPK